MIISSPATHLTSGARRPSSSHLLVPALLLVVGLLVAGGRLWFARTTVNEAAQTAARAASLSRSAYAAASAGQDAGSQSLATAGLRCRSTSVSISTAAFSRTRGNALDRHLDDHVHEWTSPTLSFLAGLAPSS